MTIRADHRHPTPPADSAGAIVVRPLRPADHERAAQVREGAYAHELGDRLREGYRAELRDVARHAELAQVLVAVDASDALLGTVTFLPTHDNPLSEHDEPRAASLRFLAVDPSAQGQGIAQRLVRACEDLAREHAAARLVLHVLSDNHRAARLYAHLGFVRDRDLDWEPFPGLVLQGWALPLR